MSNRKYKLNDDFFEKIDCEEKAYFLGIIYSDGCLYEKGKNSKTISIKQQEERKDIIYKFKKALNSTHNINIFLHGSKLCYSLLIYSEKMFNDLVDKGLSPRKSLTINFPTFINKSLMPHFIRGLFDGDGCIWNGKRKKMIVKKENKPNEFRERIVHNVKINYTGNKNFVESLQDYLVENIGINKTKLNFAKAKNNSNNTNENVCSMEYCGRGNAKKFYDYMYKSATIFSEEKKAKFDIVCAFDAKASNEPGLIAGNPLEP